MHYYSPNPSFQLHTFDVEQGFIPVDDQQYNLDCLTSALNKMQRVGDLTNKLALLVNDDGIPVFRYDPVKRCGSVNFHAIPPNTLFH